MSEILLETRNLTREFPFRKKDTVHAVTDVSLQIRAGETLALVGESGCGKSTLGRMMIRMLRPTSGEVFFRGTEITSLNAGTFRPLRRQMQMIFQDPYASLDPRMSVRSIIAEPLRTWKLCENRQAETERVQELMAAVGVPAEMINRYPHQLSGGQRQRVGIARAIAADPALIVCDEPVSALDVSVQNQILNLLRRLQKERNLTYLFISHDLSVVRHISDRVAVMFLGKVCETGETETVCGDPRHPYTRFLLDAAPVPDPHRRRSGERLLQGEMPSPVNVPSGCRFHTRCPFATEECAKTDPPMRMIGGRGVACHHPEKAGTCGR